MQPLTSHSNITPITLHPRRQQACLLALLLAVVLPPTPSKLFTSSNDFICSLLTPVLLSLPLLIDYSLFSYNTNLRNWLEVQSGSISPAENIRSRLAGTARSAERTSFEATRAREASSCEATSLRSRLRARSAISVPHSVQAVGRRCI